jgi:Protein of unknown function (DUF1153)
MTQFHSRLEKLAAAWKVNADSVVIHLFPPRQRTRDRALTRRLDASRWGVLCKAAAAAAVDEGHLSAAEACDFCAMQAGELEVWRGLVQDQGLRRMLAGRL